MCIAQRFFKYLRTLFCVHRATLLQVSTNIILCASRNVTSSIYEHYFVCIAQRFIKYLQTLFCVHRATFLQVSTNIILCASRNVTSSIYEHYFVCIAQRFLKYLYLRTLFRVHRASFLQVSTNIILCIRTFYSVGCDEIFKYLLCAFVAGYSLQKKKLYLHLKIIKKKTRSSPCYATANRTTQPLSYRSAERPTHLVSKQLAAFLHQQPEPEKVRGKGKTSTTKISLTLCCMIYFFRRFFEI